ncbi:MAG: glycosyltransferase [Terrimicrobiaceae bacterium]|nr:glycosyltransferase [Terrimicrobiaceae bacterium]
MQPASSSGEVLRRTIAVIPARNEDGHVGHVVRELLAAGVSRVRVVNNGSTDATAAAARAAGAEVIDESRPGYGQACWTGTRDLPADVEWILFCDADGSDDLAALPEFVAAAETNDLVLGDRMATADGRAVMSPAQRFGNWLAPALLRLTYGRRFRDLGPMRLVRRDAFDRMEMRDRGFGWTVEMQARACELGLRTREIPVRYFKRRAGVSKISGNLRGTFLAGTIILSTLGRFFLARHGAWITTLVLFAGALVMAPHGHFRTPGNVPWFLAGFAILCIGYVISAGAKWSWPGLFLAACVCRLVLLPMEPGTDVWRYIWEGLIQWHGHNPYLVPPLAPELAGLATDWHAKINHPTLTAGYPPPVLLFFALLAGLSPTLLWFKAVIVAADLAVVTLLARRFGPERAAWYGLCPLVVYVFAGGAHFDSLMLLPMVLGWFAWEDKRPLAACAWLGVAVAAKYVALPLLAFALWRLIATRRFGSALLGLAVGVAPVVLGLAWFWLRDGVHALAPTEMTNYARSAEFLPRIVEALFPATARENTAFLIPFVIGLAVLTLWRRSFPKFGEDFFLLLFAVTPAVHAWYFTWALPFASATGNLAFRVAGMTAGLYFLLEHRQALGPSLWQQTWWEWAALWLPIVAAFAFSRWRRANSTECCGPAFP